MQKEIIHLFHPEEVLEAIKENLFHLYMKDYGKDKKKTIESRWDNTVFILDSNPVETRDFVLRNRQQISKSEFIKSEVEYLDYVRKEKILREEIKKEFYAYLEQKYQIYSREEQDALLNQKEGKEYSWNVIRDIEYYRSYLEASLEEALIENTRWGKRLQNKYKDITIEQLREILFDHTFHASTNVLKDKNQKIRTICFIPLIKLWDTPSLDRIVLHELRHVVETEDKRSGLEEFENPEFSMLNEIRTENNAKRDEARLPILFHRKTKGIQSIYELILSKIEELESFEEVLNIAAFTGKIDSIREEIIPLSKRVTEEDIRIQKKLKGNIQI